MKRLVSVVLSIILILSCIPMVFAEDTSLDPDLLETHNQLVLRYQAYALSVYFPFELTGEPFFDEGPVKCLEKCYVAKAIDINTNITLKYPYYDFNEDYFITHPDDLPEIVKILSQTLELFETILYHNDIYSIALDMYGYLQEGMLIEKNETFKSDSFQNYLKSLSITYPRIVEAQNKIMTIYRETNADPYSHTQQEFDDAVREYFDLIYEIIDCHNGTHKKNNEDGNSQVKVCPFCNFVYGCAHSWEEYTDLSDGTHYAICSLCFTESEPSSHVWGEYISNGDATTEADGTKTAKCTLCDAEDTVTDTGSKLVEEEKGFFRIIIQKIKSFFETIVTFFQKLFAI